MESSLSQPRVNDFLIDPAEFGQFRGGEGGSGRPFQNSDERQAFLLAQESHVFREECPAVYYFVHAVILYEHSRLSHTFNAWMNRTEWMAACGRFNQPRAG